jgi:hypothetical protein
MSVRNVMQRVRSAVARPSRSAARSVDRRPEVVRPADVPPAPAISYSPRLDGDPDPGEVVWTWVPYEDDPRQGKDRPVLVIGREGDRLIALALSSKDRTDRADCIELGRGPWDHEQRISYVKLDRVLRIDPDEMRREGAVIERKRFDRVVQRLAEIQSRR